MNISTITPGQLADLARSGAAVELIDVRTPVEFREVHVAFARNVPLDQLDPDRLVAYNVSLDTVFDALRENNANTGGAYIERAQEQYVIRGEGLVATLQDIDNIVVSAAQDGTPVYIKNLGRTAFAPMVRQGAVTRDGRGEIVTGVVMMLMGENSRVVAERVREELQSIQASLPEGVEIDAYYNRTDLVQRRGRQVAAGPRRDVVEHERQLGRVVHGAHVGDQAGLRRAVVVRHHDQRCVGAEGRDGAGALDRLAGAVGAGAGPHERPAARPLDHARDHALLLGQRERGGLARRAARHQAGDPGG